MMCIRRFFFTGKNIFSPLVALLKSLIRLPFPHDINEMFFSSDRALCTDGTFLPGVQVFRAVVRVPGRGHGVQPHKPTGLGPGADTQHRLLAGASVTSQGEHRSDYSK